jgi:large subunit ribosomal protein L2
MEINAYKELTTSEPEKSLLLPNPKSGGRNNLGRKTIGGRSGGNKNKYRIIDFKRNKPGIPATVATIEYDPNRSSFISLLNYADGEKRYILSVQNLNVGDKVMSGPESPIKPGCSLPLEVIPLGTRVHNIELQPGRGGQLVRTAGQSAQIIGREGDFVIIRLPSKEIRLFRNTCIATVGVISNPDHGNITLGKAGAARWRGIAPQSRGVAMNPFDHPHGGGEGRTKGYKTPTSRTGVCAKGGKTRDPKSKSDKYIIKKRSRNN